MTGPFVPDPDLLDHYGNRVAVAISDRLAERIDPNSIQRDRVADVQGFARHDEHDGLTPPAAPDGVEVFLVHRELHAGDGLGFRDAGQYELRLLQLGIILGADDREAEAAPIPRQ